MAIIVGLSQISLLCCHMIDFVELDEQTLASSISFIEKEIVGQYQTRSDTIYILLASAQAQVSSL